MDENPLVSVIVPTRNSDATLSLCLEAIRLQTYSNLEIIIVDNHSTDGTRETASRYGAKTFLKGPERGAQRNHGAEKASGKFLLFLDSDIEITPKVIEECVMGLEKDDVQIMVIPELFVGETFWARCRALEKTCYISKDIDNNIEAARFFSKNVFWKVGGYDETIIGIEDWDLPQRARESGYKQSKINSFMIHHEGKLSLGKSVWKAFYYGKHSSSYFDKDRSNVFRHVFISRFVWLKKWRLLTKQPSLMVGMFFMKKCEFIAAFIGYITSKMN
mgnify:CR=1 FL=1